MTNTRMEKPNVSSFTKKICQISKWQSGRGQRQTSYVYLTEKTNQTVGEIFLIAAMAANYPQLYLHTTMEAVTIHKTGVLEPIRLEEHEVLRINFPDKRIEKAKL